MKEIKCLDEITEAETLLRDLKHNIMWRPSSTKKLIQRDIAKVKALVDAVDLLFNPKPIDNVQPQLQQHDVSSSAEIEKPLTQCMVGRDTECNHPKCPVTDEDAANGRYCTLPLYDYRQ